MFFKNCYTYYQILHIFLQDNARDELVANVDAKFLQLSNYLGCKKFLMGNATTVADFALYDALKWHHALDGHLVAKYGNIVEYIGKQIWPKMYWYIFHEFFVPWKTLFVFPSIIIFSLLQIGLKIFPKWNPFWDAPSFINHIFHLLLNGVMGLIIQSPLKLKSCSEPS